MAGMAGGAILGVCFFVLALIIAAFPIVRLIGWWIDGGIEPVVAFVGTMLYLALVVSTVGMPSALKVVFLLLLILSAALMPMLGQVSEKRQNQDIEDGHLTAYVAALERDPMDAVARIALGEALYKRGDREQAREHMEWTLKQYPALAGRIKPVLETWERDARYEQGEGPVICHMCYAENLPRSTACEACGAEFGTRSAILQRIALEGGPRAVARTWVLTGSVLLLWAFSVLYLPALVSGPIIIASAIVGAVVLVKWVGGTLGTSEG